MSDESVIIATLIGKIGEVLVGKTLDESLKKKINPKRDIHKLIHSYVKKRMKRLLVINTIVLGNRRILLDDIYIPLRICNDREEYFIDCYPEKLFKEHSNVLITDTAGMGKSTLLKKLYFSSIYQDLGIPFLIEMRRLSDSESLFSHILKELKIEEGGPEMDAINYLFENGGFVFFFDGYDEISDDRKSFVSDAIHKFTEDYFDENRFFLTSRPEPGLIEFGSFSEFSIQGLQEEESFELIRKYDRSQTVSSLLIQKLKEPQFYGLKDFLKNPLLTSLLYRAFEYKNKIPIRKNQFYRQVYDANFEAHDLTKGGAYFRPKRSNLDTEDFHRVLRFIGFECFQRQKVEFDNRDSILSVISNAKKYYNLSNFKPSDFLDDLLKAVPLFNKDGNYYKWNHRSIQEYFAAQFIFMDSKNDQRKILEKLYYHKSLRYYFHTLELYADTDPVSFRNVIELQFLRDYLTHYDDSVLKIGKSSKEIEKRIDHLFYRKIKLVQDSQLKFLEVDRTFDSEEITDEEDNLEINENLLMDLHSINFNDDVFDEPISNWRSQGVLTWPRFSSNTFMSRFINIKVEISEILYNMGRRYISKQKYGTFRDIEVIISKDNQDRVFEMNFDPNLWFNQNKMLKTINNLLDCNQSIYRFDVELVKKEIKEILQRTEEIEDFIKF